MLSLYKFFPYGSLFVSDDNTLTAWWVLGTIGYFIISGYYLFTKISTISQSIIKCRNQFSSEAIQNNELLQQPWKEYSRTFIAKEGERQKTFEEAVMFFNDQTIISHFLSLRYWQSVPGTLVGFGILGTFVGLTLGISGFDIGSTERIIESIKVLLSGMGTAFVSSVWGMLLSIIFGFLEKWKLKNLSKQIGALCQALDEKFKITRADELRFLKEDQDGMFKQYFVFQSEDNNEIFPAHVFRDLRRESAQQTKALKSFSTDLADGIRISSETINALGSQIIESVTGSFKSELVPVLDKLETAVGELREVKEESSGAVIERVVNNLQKYLGDMSTQFHSSLSGSVASHIEELAKIVVNAGNTLSDFPAQLQSMMGVLDQHISNSKSILDSSGETVHKAMTQHLQEAEDVFNGLMNQLRVNVSTQQQVIQDTATKASEETMTAIACIREETTKASGEFSDIIQSLQNKMETLLDQQNQTAHFLERVIANSREVFDKGSILANTMNTSITMFNGTLENIKTLSAQLRISAERLNESGDQLHDSTQIFKEQSDLFLVANRNTLSQLETALKQAEELSTNYSNKFRIIQDGLSNIFSQIQDGLVRYQEATRESINDYLKQFTDQLEIAVTSLRGSIEELKEVVEGISEINSKTK